MLDTKKSQLLIEILQTDLLKWFEESKRDLPFRRTRDPYFIWISEIMAQQTQIDTLIPYYNRFIDNFPTVFSLALASIDEVIKAWEGLGYYSRARNLHQRPE
jgi:A/G-specific DNA-adenine glycosylase (EC 3.2.2.-)